MEYMDPEPAQANESYINESLEQFVKVDERDHYSRGVQAAMRERQQKASKGEKKKIKKKITPKASENKDTTKVTLKMKNKTKAI